MAYDFTQWWKDWQAEDYSWDGLAHKPWAGWCVLPDGRVVEDPSSWPEEDDRHAPRPHGARPATLQDYWRDQKDDLIPCPVSGKRFTIIHLPLEWEDGTPTPKVDQTKVLRAKLAAAAGAGEFDFLGEPDGPDRRAQCGGAVLRNFDLAELCSNRNEDGRTPVYLSASRCFFAGVARFSWAAFSVNTWFKGTAFSGNALFDSAAFSGDARFDSAAFLGNGWFSDAAFSGAAAFEGATFSDDAWFNRTSFSGDAFFNSATFSRNAWFLESAFSRYVRFNSANVAGDGSFNKAVFSKTAWFDHAAFSGDAMFDGAVFWEGVTFSYAVFARNARFTGAAFSGLARLDRAVFAGTADFRGEGVALSQPASHQLLIVQTEDRPPQRHEGALTTPAAISPLARRAFRCIEARRAVFLGEALFENRDVYEASRFDRTRFFKRASFHDSKLKQSTTFLDAQFEASLDPARQHAAGARGDDAFAVPEWALKRLHAAEARRREITGEDPITYAKWWTAFDDDRAKDAAAFSARNPDDPTRGAYFAELEDAFRTLKRAMEDNRNKPEEGRFFKLELKARRQRREPGVPLWERLMSDLYGLLSDYGNSAARPAGWLLALFVMFTLIYAPLATLWVRAPTLPEWGEAASYSAGRVLPFGPWAGDPPACSAMGRLLDVQPSHEQLASDPACRSGLANTAGPWTVFGISFLATIQSLLALILAFLAALAARRRFQIN